MDARDTADTSDLAADMSVSMSALEPAVLRSALQGDPGALAQLPRLPFSRTEVRQVARLLPGAQVLLGPEASEARLAELAATGELGRFDIIHLATHTLVADEQPGVSALVLSRSPAAGSPSAPADSGIGVAAIDGLVTMPEVMRTWRLDADLVTLSGCQTGYVTDSAGEASTGIAYYLMEVGARSLLVSLWKVEDRATCLLMRRFYENLTGTYADRRDGRNGRAMGKDDALREAKHWLCTLTDAQGRHPFAHPAYWSGFVLVGAAR
jgi:CHAT domain-containing protein